MAKSALIKRCLFLFLCAWAQAGLAIMVDVNFTYTGDNEIVDWWIIDESGPTLINPTPSIGTNAADWTNADSQTIALEDNRSYSVIFWARNIGAPGLGNPAGFLAEIKGVGTPPGLVSGELLTSQLWDYALVSPSPTWSSVSEYGNNGLASLIWTVNRPGAIPDISTAAEWIWSGDNGTLTTPAELFLRGQFSIALVPLPPAVWLFGSSLIALIAVARRRTRLTTA